MKIQSVLMKFEKNSHHFLCSPICRRCCFTHFILQRRNRRKERKFIPFQESEVKHVIYPITPLIQVSSLHVSFLYYSFRFVSFSFYSSSDHHHLIHSFVLSSTSPFPPLSALLLPRIFFRLSSSCFSLQLFSLSLNTFLQSIQKIEDQKIDGEKNNNNRKRIEETKKELRK